MIHYNFRYRGPFEYDKFVLNALQLQNKLNYVISKQNNNGLNAYIDQVNAQYDNAKKQCDNIYNLLVNYRR